METEGVLLDAANHAVGPPRSRDGRDELNLAEFPLGVLSDRVPAGQKTLTFEDKIFDQGRSEWITRRLTISASDKYGLPTALDDEVILGLIQVSREAQFANRKVEFSRYHLLDVLGWRDEGRSYHRLDESLRRWIGVTLYYDKAWWDKGAQSWVDESFHILDHVSIRRRSAEKADADGKKLLSSFTWNEAVFKSFQAGYLKQLDFEFYRKLSLPTSKRMYRFLDKRFYHKPVCEFGLLDFACEKVGMSRNYDVAQVKRKLLPAIKELEDVNYLEPMPASKRFVKVRRGDWRIVLRKKEVDVVAASPSNPVVELLIGRGVTEKTARELVQLKGEAEVEKHVAAFDFRVTCGDAKALRNPAGFLVKAIRDGYLLAGAPTKQAEKQPPAENTPSGPAPQELRAEREAAAIRDYLEALPEKERATFEVDAMREADPVTLRGYQRMVKEGKVELARLYHQTILGMHVKRLREAAGTAVRAA